VHNGETLCGWQYRSKGEVKGVRNAGHEVIGHIRLWVRTRPVFSLGSGRVAELTGLWLVEVTGMLAVRYSCVRCG
jgi:hypothetical protein